MPTIAMNLPGKRPRLEEEDVDDSNCYKKLKPEKTSTIWSITTDKPVGFVIPQPVVRENSSGDLNASTHENEVEFKALKDCDGEEVEQNHSDSDDSCVQRDGTSIITNPGLGVGLIESEQVMDKVTPITQPHKGIPSCVCVRVGCELNKVLSVCKWRKKKLKVKILVMCFSTNGESNNK